MKRINLSNKIQSLKKVNIKEIAKIVNKNITDNNPKILMGLGIAGMFTAGFYAVSVTPKALRLIEMGIEDINAYNKSVSSDDNYIPVTKPTKQLMVTTCWKTYAPSILLAGLSTACLLQSNKVSSRRTAALATAYKLSETAFNEYREKIIETIGEKKEHDVRDKIAEDVMKKHTVNENSVIITNNGDTLCLDTVSGQYFKSSIETIKKAENKLNRKMFNDMYISLNELYDELGLRQTVLGDDLGWNIDNGYLDLYYSAQLTEEGVPCLVLNYDVAPRYGYSVLER